MGLSRYSNVNLAVEFLSRIYKSLYNKMTAFWIVSNQHCNQFLEEIVNLILRFLYLSLNKLVFQTSEALQYMINTIYHKILAVYWFACKPLDIFQLLTSPKKLTTWVTLGNVHKWRPTFFGHFWPTYHVRRFLPYNVQYLGTYGVPLPTLKLDVIYGRSHT